MKNPELEIQAAKESLLKTLIVVQLCIAAVVGFAGDMFVSYQFSFAEMNVIESSLMVIGIMLGIGGLIGLIGLWYRWRPARLIFTLCTILMPALILFNIPMEVSATNAGSFFISTGNLAAGATIALLYFGHMEDYFGAPVSDDSSAAG